MGLDMYMYRAQLATDSKDTILNRDDWSEAPAEYENLQGVGYWRKANAIHGWIIKNIANGVDECQAIPLSYDNLQDLLSEIKNELHLQYNKDEKGNLDPYEGFFFGSYDRDEYYYEYLDESVPTLQSILDLMCKKDWDPFRDRIVYFASW